MNESADTPSKNGSPRSDSSERRVLAHVEKWMAVIREISNARGK